MQKTPRLAGLIIKLLIKINNLGLGGGRGVRQLYYLHLLQSIKK